MAEPRVIATASDDFVAAAADLIAERIQRAAGPRCRLVLAGGGTPRPVYEALAKRSDLDWSRVDFLWGDERAVGPDDAKSNYRMAKEALLDPIGAVDGQVFRIEGERAAAEAAAAYASTVQGLQLDLVLLGMGGDGHTASMFPGDPPSRDEASDVVVTTSPVPPTTRISMSLRALNAAAHVVFLVTGAGKAARLAEVWRQRDTADPVLPAAMINPSPGELVWMLDHAAAAQLPIANPANETKQ